MVDVRTVAANNDGVDRANYCDHDDDGNDDDNDLYGGCSANKAV